MLYLDKVPAKAVGLAFIFKSYQTVQELFGNLNLPCLAAPEALAALAALVKHLHRLNADSELVTQAQMVCFRFSSTGNGWSLLAQSARQCV